MEKRLLFKRFCSFTQKKVVAEGVAFIWLFAILNLGFKVIFDLHNCFSSAWQILSSFET
jgi:hypothetical protein